MIPAKDAREHSEKVRVRCFERQLQVVEDVIADSVSRGLTCCTVEFDFVCSDMQAIQLQLVEAGYEITTVGPNYVCISWR